jgi:2-polyprenyl-3-methyl-5-hydroxy-6-metoxy-1,4-benzoquinol methylase
MSTSRADREILHGMKLARADAETIWGWGTPAGQRRAERRGRLIAEGAGLRAGMNALEIGCGTGVFTAVFAASGARIVAVDISPDLLARARQRGLPAEQVCFLEKRFEDCDIDGPFDAVIGSSVLHHLDVPKALARIFELLRPGGALSFAEPNLLNPQIFVQKNVPWIKRRLGDSPDETAFVRWKLARLLQQTGFQDMRITPFDWLHPITPRALIGAVSAAGSCLERLPLVREFAGSLFIRARKPAA